MNKQEAMRLARQESVLIGLGFTRDEADKLRRISRTLTRWFELECGDSNDYASWAIERDEDTDKPYMVRHIYCRAANASDEIRTPIADRETGARKRLAAIIGQRNGRPGIVGGRINAAPAGAVTAYVQTDPRGAALYIIRPGDVPAAEDVGSYYNRGICVY